MKCKKKCGKRKKKYRTNKQSIMKETTIKTTFSKLFEMGEIGMKNLKIILRLGICKGISSGIAIQCISSLYL